MLGHVRCWETLSWPGQSCDQTLEWSRHPIVDYQWYHIMLETEGSLQDLVCNDIDCLLAELVPLWINIFIGPQAQHLLAVNVSKLSLQVVCQRLSCLSCPRIHYYWFPQECLWFTFRKLSSNRLCNFPAHRWGLEQRDLHARLWETAVSAVNLVSWLFFCTMICVFFQGVIDSEIDPGFSLSHDDFVAGLFLVLNLIVASELFKHKLWGQTCSQDNFLAFLVNSLQHAYNCCLLRCIIPLARVDS